MSGSEPCENCGRPVTLVSEAEGAPLRLAEITLKLGPITGMTWHTPERCRAARSERRSATNDPASG